MGVNTAYKIKTALGTLSDVDNPNLLLAAIQTDVTDQLMDVSMHCYSVTAHKAVLSMVIDQSMYISLSQDLRFGNFSRRTPNFRFPALIP